jgi:hypothetical protein
MSAEGLSIEKRRWSGAIPLRSLLKAKVWMNTVRATYEA